MKKLSAIFIGFVVAVRVLSATDTSAAETATSAGQNNPPRLEVKNKSSFALEDSGRNPFWPIGWKPAGRAAKQTTDQPVGPEIRDNAFTVSSITMDPKDRFAIINGKVMTEGTVFGLQMGSQTYQITVKAIQDGRVVLLRRDQEIIVPLRRR